MIHLLDVYRLILKNKVLVVGGTGLFGVNWAVNQRNLSDVVLCLHQRNIRLPGVEVTKFAFESVDSILECFCRFEPDLVINAAGFTSVEGCETFPDKAFSFECKATLYAGFGNKNLKCSAGTFIH